MAHRQLVELGYTRHLIQGRIESARLIRMYKGVYAVGHTNLSARGRWMAAVLACGPTALLSHRAAAALLDLRPSHATWIDVTIPGTPRKRRRPIRVHCTRTLHPEEITTADGVPCTSVARTILDLSAVLNADRVVLAIEQAVRMEVLDFRALQRSIDRSPHRAGTTKLRRILATYEEPKIYRSGYERRVVKFLERHSPLAPPLVNVFVAGVLVDLHWPQFGLVVELDGTPYHNTPRAFEQDRRTDAILQRARLRVLRVTETRFDQEPFKVLDDIVALSRLSEAA